MVDYAERIKELEEELKKTPYNKATQHHIGLVKAKIARLRDKALARSAKSGAGHSYSVRKAGDASVVLVGYPSVGKSTVLNALTNASSETAAYAFTTLDVIPGQLEYNHAQIQILDLPGILKGASIGRGRGREVLSVVRNADLVLFIVEVGHPEHYPILKKEIYDSGLRLNAKKPDVRIMKKPRGGIRIGTTVKLTRLTRRTIESILREFRISNADIVIRTDITAEQLIDVIEDNRIYVPSLLLLSKIDMVSPERLHKIEETLRPDISVSAEKRINIEKLKELIFRKLDFIRIYCKQVGKKADMDVPLILKRSSTVETACNKLHRNFSKSFRFARIWGSSAKFPGQRLSLKHILQDKDIIEIHVR